MLWMVQHVQLYEAAPTPVAFSCRKCMVRYLCVTDGRVLSMCSQGIHLAATVLLGGWVFIH
jgi:hypothetical protein